jgi:hypothetical protein
MPDELNPRGAVALFVPHPGEDARYLVTSMIASRGTWALIVRGGLSL